MTNVEDGLPDGAAQGPRTAVQQIALGAEDAGQRLDKVLTRLLPTVPRSLVFRMLRKGEVRLNGKRVKGDARTAEGDLLRIPPYREAPPEAVEAAEARKKAVPQKLIDQLEKAIIHEDERLLVLDKPSGVAVHGGSGIGFGVIEILRASRPEETLELVHRLDRDTSGCLLVARKRSTLRTLHALLREDAFDKRYLVLVRGKWELGAKRIDAPLRTDLRVGGERTVKVDPHGKAAASDFRVVQFYGNLATLLEVKLLTGRTHQIRVHAQYAGHPVAGDPKYGDPEFNAQMKEFGLGRLFLHAHAVSYEDPDRRVEVAVNAPLSDELRSVLDRLTTVPNKVRPRGVTAGRAPRRGAPPRAR
ncbi:MAG: hypothetical protein RLZZ200_2730 [Pseudomonadota bacterium]|jgi:23S rRNA pseudouridine955/2504/2580 synthase